ncbi:MAG: corrinoid protein [Clostridiales bacterium]|nr:corrinoid protein [Clostridiales bacterium]
MDNRPVIEAVMTGEEGAALEYAKKLLAEGAAPLEIIDMGLIPAMARVGCLFKEGEMYVPEVMMAASVVSAVVEFLKPLLAGKISYKGTVVLGTVKGDMHDIGKNLVALLLENNGFKVVDLGADISPVAFIEAAASHAAQIVGLSALLTTTMPAMAETVQAFEQAGCRDKVKIIIGGAPVTAGFAAEIKADGYAKDAVGAVELCLSLL